MTPVDAVLRDAIAAWPIEELSGRVGSCSDVKAREGA